MTKQITLNRGDLEIKLTTSFKFQESSKRYLWPSKRAMRYWCRACWPNTLTFIILTWFLVINFYLCTSQEFEIVPHPELSASLAPGAPADLRILPLSDAQLDVDIHPSTSEKRNAVLSGDPTRYNISYEFRMWKKNTNVQKISIHQSSGIVVSMMRMEILYVNEKNLKFRYVNRKN